MNKAFVRESDAPPPRCPAAGGCGGLGIPVSPATLSAHLSPEDAARFSGEAFYCPNPECDRAYFDGWGMSVGREAVARLSFPKDPAGPLCSCLNVPADAIREEALAGEKTLVRRILAYSRSEEADCERRSPDGCSCERSVRRLFLDTGSRS